MLRPLSTALALALALTASLPAQQLQPAKVYPEFGIGPTGIRVTIEKGLVVTLVSVVTIRLTWAGAKLRAARDGRAFPNSTSSRCTLKASTQSQDGPGRNYVHFHFA